MLFLPGNHLYPPAHLAEHEDACILMVEDESICRRRGYHRQKLALVLAAMREHAETLTDAGFNVRYYRLEDSLTLESAIKSLAEDLQSTELLSFEIADVHLEARLGSIASDLDLTWRRTADPGFLTSREDFDAWAKDKKQLQMGRFYKVQRQAQNLLISDEDDGEPEGGQWSFDEDNRRKLPKDQSVPDIPKPTFSNLSQATIKEVNERFDSHPGDASDLWIPTTRDGALHWLNDFIDERLIGFGTFEDAITTRSATLFHSALSPLINLGLITPDEVIDAVEQRAKEVDVPLNDREGLIRQIIGWREFIRGVYDHHGEEMRAHNRRGHTRKLTRHWHEGDTGIPPLDDAIGHQLTLGWTHHINRLMVLSNLMNLCEIDPEEVYEYFMCYYVDAYDWVMVPNVYGMGLTSDSGVFATKPYVCGSNYLLKMSDFSKGDWCDTVDGLYWRFVKNNRDEFEQNPRMGFTLSNLDKMKADRAERIFDAAEQFLDRCTKTA